MVSGPELLARLEARDPWTMIQELSETRTRRKRGEPVDVPLATFHMRTGRDIAGYVWDLREGDGGWSLLVQTSGGGQTLDVTYLDPRNVEAVTVRDAPRCIEVLSFGAVEHADDVPTAIAIKRHLEELGRQLSNVVGEPVTIEIDWDAIPSDDAALLSAARAIDAIEGAIRNIANASDLADLVGHFARIRLEHAEPGVRATDTSLIISAALDRGRPGRLDRAELERAIEAVI